MDTLDILVVVPTYETIATECYESLWNLTKQINVKVDFKAIKGYDCARTRNEAVEYFLKSDKEYTHLMMVDSDIILPKILETDPLYIYSMLTNSKCQDIVLGWYPRKNEPRKTELFMQGYDSYSAAARWNCSELRQWPEDIIQIKGGGFGCAIISRKVLTHVTFPYFRYELRDDNTYISEDLYFCNKVHDLGYTIYTKKSLACDHINKSIVRAISTSKG